MRTKPLPQQAHEQLVAHTRTITALYPGARDIRYLDIGTIRMAFTGAYMWARSPWKLLNFSVPVLKHLFLDSGLDDPGEVRNTATVVEQSYFERYVYFALILPDNRLSYATTLAELRRLHALIYP